MKGTKNETYIPIFLYSYILINQGNQRNQRLNPLSPSVFSVAKFFFYKRTQFSPKSLSLRHLSDTTAAYEAKNEPNCPQTYRHGFQVAASRAGAGPVSLPGYIRIYGVINALFEMGILAKFGCSA
jgi:hypothetical protein